MPSGLPLKREVSFLLIQADAASRRGLIQALNVRFWPIPLKNSLEVTA